MRRKLYLFVLATAFLRASQIEPSTKIENGTFTWTIKVPNDSPISSIHIGGPELGDSNTKTTGPDDWDFVGQTQKGDFSWQTKSNVSGTFTFTFHLDSVFDKKDASIQTDTIGDDGKRTYTDVQKPADSDNSNWAIVPASYTPPGEIPEPGVLILTATGLIAIGLKRKMRSTQN